MSKADDITLQDLAETMDQQWRSLYGQCKMKLITGDDRNDTEVALAAFAGKFHNCQQVGHKAADCPHKRNMGKSNKNKQKCCSHCGKLGHIKANCWNRPENSNKRPKCYKLPRIDSNEQSNVAVDDGNIDPISELLCMALEKKLAFPSIAELLKDPCVWISDTGAPNHLPFHHIRVMVSKGILAKQLTKCNKPFCTACQYSKLTYKPWRMKGVPARPTRMAQKPGQIVSMDQLKSSTTGSVAQLKGKLTTPVISVHCGVCQPIFEIHIHVFAKNPHKQ